MTTELKGGYFQYCQWCRHDGNCELKHNEFTGMKPDPYQARPTYSHEDVSQELIAFQEGTPKGGCPGRIVATDNFYMPLACRECQSTIPSISLQVSFYRMCRKFGANEKGVERLELAKKIASEKGIKLEEVTPDLLPPPDPNYKSVMKF